MNDVLIHMYTIRPKIRIAHVPYEEFRGAARDLKEILFGHKYFLTGSGELLQYGLSKQRSMWGADFDIVAKNLREAERIKRTLLEQGFKEYSRAEQGMHVVRSTDGELATIALSPKTQWLHGKLNGSEYVVNISPRRVLLLYTHPNEVVFGRYFTATPGRGVAYKLIRGFPKDIFTLSQVANVGKLSGILSEKQEIITPYAYRAYRNLRKVINKTQHGEERQRLNALAAKLREENKRYTNRFKFRNWSIPLDERWNARLPQGERIIVTAARFRQYLKPLP